MDEGKRGLRSAQKGRTLERKMRRHDKCRERDLYGLYRNKRAEIVLIHRPFMYWIKPWNRREYHSGYEYEGLS
jgi:hypothetical protein